MFVDGMSSADQSSDWNAPAEEWGNYGEEELAPPPHIEEAEQEVPKVNLSPLPPALALFCGRN